VAVSLLSIFASFTKIGALLIGGGEVGCARGHAT